MGWKETLKDKYFWLGLIGGPILYAILWLIYETWSKHKYGFVAVECPKCESMIPRMAEQCWKCKTHLTWR